jgi:hypothetical protein
VIVVVVALVIVVVVAPVIQTGSLFQHEAPVAVLAPVPTPTVSTATPMVLISMATPTVLASMATPAVLVSMAPCAAPANAQPQLPQPPQPPQPPPAPELAVDVGFGHDAVRTSPQRLHCNHRFLLGV